MKIEKDYIIFRYNNLQIADKYYIHKIDYYGYNTGYYIRVGYIPDIADKLIRNGYIKILNKFELKYNLLIPSDEGEYFIDYKEDIKPISPRKKHNWHREIEFILYIGIKWIRLGIFTKIPQNN